MSDDQPWTPEGDPRDRSHRPGQTQRRKTFYTISGEDIDNLILDRLLRKRTMSDQIRAEEQMSGAAAGAAGAGSVAAAVADTVDRAEALVATRESTHGDYATMAQVQISLVQAMESSPNWGRMHPGVKVGLMSTAMKMARILTGDWTTADHFDDIEGYIRLAGKVAAEVRARAASDSEKERAKKEREIETERMLAEAKRKADLEERERQFRDSLLRGEAILAQPPLPGAVWPYVGGPPPAGGVVSVGVPSLAGRLSTGVPPMGETNISGVAGKLSPDPVSGR